MASILRATSPRLANGGGFLLTCPPEHTGGEIDLTGVEEAHVRESIGIRGRRVAAFALDYAAIAAYIGLLAGLNAAVRAATTVPAL